MISFEKRRFSMVVVERSSMSTASAGTWRFSVRYRRIDSASDTTSSLPCPPEATNTPVLPCFSHNGRRQQRHQRRQRHAEIHSGLPHQSSSSRRCAETRHYTAEPAAVPLTPAAIHHRLFPPPACAMPYNRRFVLFTRLGHTAATSCVYSTGRISIWNRIISCCWESSS